MYAHFVDFENAFDSVHRESLYHEKLWDTTQNDESDNGHIQNSNVWKD